MFVSCFPMIMKQFLLIFLCLGLLQSITAQQPDSLNTTRDSLLNIVQDSAGIAKKKSKLNVSRPPEAEKASTEQAQKPKNNSFNRFFVKKYPNPRAAALLAIVPGGGQAYNKKWWKIPLVYGALGGMSWWAISTNQQYVALRDNYKWVVDEDPNTNPFEEPYTFMSSSQLKGYRDIYRNYTEKRFLWLGITYLLSITDAFVDAHLARFDVSDDLSLKVVPAIQSGGGGFGPAFGVGLQLGIGRP